jgi:hypothetical protein
MIGAEIAGPSNILIKRKRVVLIAAECCDNILYQSIKEVEHAGNS